MQLAAQLQAPLAAAAWTAPAADPPKIQALQQSFVEQQMRLWSSLLAGERESLGKSDPGDRRFAAKEWRDNPYYDYLKQSYLLASQLLNRMAEEAVLDSEAKSRLRFAVKQWTDAMSPANFAATNPEALRQAIASQGESITRGLANLLGDARRGRISQTDETAFEVGRNLAVTPGDLGVFLLVAGHGRIGHLLQGGGVSGGDPVETGGQLRVHQAPTS